MLGAIVAAVPGCSRRGSDQSDLGHVHGKVALDGEPFVGVIVVFTPDVGRQAAGVTDEDGSYELQSMHHSKEAKVGPNTVGFATPTGEQLSAPIPAKYANGTKTGLKETVKEGDNTFNFALTSDPKTEPDAEAEK